MPQNRGCRKSAAGDPRDTLWKKLMIDRDSRADARVFLRAINICQQRLLTLTFTGPPAETCPSLRTIPITSEPIGFWWNPNWFQQAAKDELPPLWSHCFSGHTYFPEYFVIVETYVKGNVKRGVVPGRGQQLDRSFILWRENGMNHHIFIGIIIPLCRESVRQKFIFRSWSTGSVDICLQSVRQL